MTAIGILHPGAMGISLAASARAGGHQVGWVSDGRSAATRKRAETQDLLDLGTLDAACERCDGLLSICPPHGAETLAAAVADVGFTGVYVDANAISPGRARAVADTIAAGGGRYVDGGVIGGPAWEPRGTWLHLSGAPADTAAVEAWFADGVLETNVLGSGSDRASALKMCFAAYTKGTSALFYAILGTAEALQVRDALVQQWSRSSQLAGGLAERAGRDAGGVTGKAWRWIDEMQEISRTFEAAGLPGGFHAAAAEVFRRIEGLKDAVDPATDDVVRALLATQPGR